MTTKIELKRINGDIIFSHKCENNSVAKTIEALRTSGAKFDLSGANLKYADLSNTNLSGADLPINQPLHHLGLYEDDEEIGKIYNDLAQLILYKHSK